MLCSILLAAFSILATYLANDSWASLRLSWSTIWWSIKHHTVTVHITTIFLKETYLCLSSVNPLCVPKFLTKLLHKAFTYDLHPHPSEEKSEKSAQPCHMSTCLDTIGTHHFKMLKPKIPYSSSNIGIRILSFVTCKIIVSILFHMKNQLFVTH